MKLIPYVWSVCLAGILVNELFFIQKNLEWLYFILFLLFPFVFIVSIVVWLFTKQAIVSKLKQASVPVLLFILYLFAGKLLETAALNISFVLHRSSYENFAKQVLAESNVLFKEKKQQAESGSVSSAEILSSLWGTKAITEQQKQLGIWGYTLLEVSEGNYAVELTLLNGRQRLGLLYNTGGGVVPPAEYSTKRIFFRTAQPWQLWKEENEKSSGFAAPG
ncbi:MAG: hypothetical protein KIS94_05820 [Chitinophagales bacterium]|nr:hypothetical protein [Chitinophagales bacterium]